MDHKGHVALVWPIKHPVFQPSEERNWWCCCHCCARYQRLLPLLGKISKAATLSVSRSHLHSWPRMCLPTLHNLPLDKWERNYFPATGRSLYVAGCGFSLIEGGIIGLARRQRLRAHLRRVSLTGGGNPPARHSSIPQTFPVLAAIIRCNRRCGWYSPGNKWSRSGA